VIQPCYQTVPVTEFRQVRQVVQRPVVETKYVEQPVTEYHPVTEARTAEIPTVTYQTVTECQACTRNMGYWQTRYQCNPKISPCAYDPRPGLMGWMNRTGYSIRQAFTPAVVARREYVPNYVTTMVPVTRQVAVPGVQQVTYNVTRMVATQTTRKVAVNTVRYVSEEIVTNQPVTVMRTVPIGSTIAYLPFGATSTALLPKSDPISNAKSASPSRSADARNNQYEEGKFQRSNERDVDDAFQGEGDKGTMITIPPRKDAVSTVSPRPFTVPTAVRVSRWAPRGERASSHNGPSLTGPGISVADNQR